MASDPQSSERPRVLAEPFAHPHQVLRLLDIGASELDSFRDGRRVTAKGEEALLKILFRMPQIGRDDIARWLQEPVPWSDLRASPGAHRGEFFLVRGRTRSLTRRPLPPELAGLFEFKHFYEVRIASTQGSPNMTVYTRVIPQAWKGYRQIDQRCRVSAMFLKLGSPEDHRQQFLFAAPRIAWIPDRPNRELGVGPAEVLLGKQGMDIGLFDTVRSRNGLPIAASERECFYALLEAAGDVSPAAAARQARPLPLVTLLQQPREFHGKLLRARGSVKRITRVAVSETDIQNRYGTDHYFQLDVFVPLGDAEIALQSPDKDAPGPVYRNSFPVTCCALSIPQQWKTLVGKQRISVDARLDGFFFKLWGYPTPYMASFDAGHQQLSPMLMITDPIAAPAGQRASNATSLLIGVFFLVILVLIWVIVWWLGRRDRKHGATLRQRRHQGEKEPDFQHLSQPDR